MDLEKVDTHIETYSSRLNILLQEDPLLASSFPRTLFPFGLVLTYLHHSKKDLISRKNLWQIELFINRVIASISSQNSWNYITNRKNSNFPDDLDDTFIFLNLLMQFDPKKINDECFIKVKLLLNEGKYGYTGPYNTWIIDFIKKKDWRDVDPVVNSVIAMFLAGLNIEYGGLKSYIEEIITTRAYVSKYYTHPLIIMHAIARSYRGDLKEMLAQHIYYQLLFLDKNQSDSTFLKALGITSLIKLNCKIDFIHKYIKNIVKNEKPMEYPLYIEHRSAIKTTYVTHEAISLAVVIESLSYYKKLLAWHSEESNSAVMFFYGSTRREARAITSHKNIFNKIIRKRTGKEILLISYLFASQLKGHSFVVKNKETIKKLSLANACGWMAYMTYDNIYDSSCPADLGKANSLMRDSYQIYSSIDPKYQTWVKDVFSTIDTANDSEYARRFMGTSNQIIVPKTTISPYLDSFKKSLGHIIGPLMILQVAGYPCESREYSQVKEILQNYLNIRQLTDDLKDWEEDLKNRIATPITNSVLQKFKAVFKNENFDISLDMHKANFIFAEFIFKEWVEKIRNICHDSIDSLNKIDFFDDVSLLVKAFQYYEKQLRSALAQQYLKKL